LLRNTVKWWSKQKPCRTGWVKDVAAPGNSENHKIVSPRNLFLSEKIDKSYLPIPLSTIRGQMSRRTPAALAYANKLMQLIYRPSQNDRGVPLRRFFAR